MDSCAKLCSEAVGRERFSLQKASRAVLCCSFNEIIPDSFEKKNQAGVYTNYASLTLPVCFVAFTTQWKDTDSLCKPESDWKDFLQGPNCHHTAFSHSWCLSFSIFKSKLLSEVPFTPRLFPAYTVGYLSEKHMENMARRIFRSWQVWSPSAPAGTERRLPVSWCMRNCVLI